MSKSWKASDLNRRPRLSIITGSYSCGKSTVLDRLRQLGYPVIDGDKVGHSLLSKPNPVYFAVLKRFGADLVAAPGEPINRALLRQRAFATRALKAELEALVVPEIVDELDRLVGALGLHGHERVFAELPNVFELKLHRRYGDIACVTCPPEIQLRNAMKRNNISQEEAEKRIAMHWPQEIKRDLSDYEIKNPGTPETLQETYANIDEYLKLSTEAAAMPVTYGNNEDYQKLVRNLARQAVTQVLEKMGDMACVAHKDGSAELSLQVDSKSTDSHGHEVVRGKKVAVNMQVCVSNVPPGTVLASHDRRCPPPTPRCPPPPPPPPVPSCPRISIGGLLMLLYVAVLILLFICHNAPSYSKSPCSSLPTKVHGTLVQAQEPLLRQHT